jgi:putative ABC transport system substrate-binding protein
LRAWGQQPTVPTIGLLFAGFSGPAVKSISDFRSALADSGFVEGRNVRIEYHYADGKYDKLADFAADLVQSHVSLIVAIPNLNAARVAQSATTSIPILFMASEDPVKRGFVASLNRPGGNATTCRGLGGLCAR